MSDLISRQVAVNAFMEATADGDKVGFCIDVINELPTVDAVPVVHGRWKWNGEAFICSVCGNGHKGQPTIMGEPMFEFCPICGARMDGEQ